MNNPIGPFFAWVSALLALRPGDRHRAGTVPPAPRTVLSRRGSGGMDSPASPTAGPQPVATSPDSDSPTPELGTAGLPLDDRVSASLRPYVVAHEQRREQRRGGAIPRVELVCAPHGMVVIR
ncbi:hypothetical protein GCM10022420_007890 [Streptomyces iranensis]|uniref:Secreted protein n=1 Tax=Streptomyces iranensis TaxID=576784 RepID=A0ABS4N5L0_9ACTN|nr:hypothetical protein [Streptomyces iranensis]